MSELDQEKKRKNLRKGELNLKKEFEKFKEKIKEGWG